MLSLKRLLFFVLLMVALPALLVAQDITPEFLITMRSVSDLQLSPDESVAAFTVTEPFIEGSRRQNVWFLDIATLEVKRFTTSNKTDRMPRWSSDSKQLAFISNRSEKSQIYLISISGGEAKAITSSESGISSFKWSPDGTQILFMAPAVETKETKEKKKEKDDSYLVDKEGQPSRLWVLSLNENKLTQLSSGNWRISEYIWLIDQKSVLVSATDNLQPELETNKIYELDEKLKEFKLIATPRGTFGGLKLAPDGKNIVFTGSRLDGPTNIDLFSLNLKTKTITNLTAKSIDRTITGYSWKDDSNLLVTTQDGFYSSFYNVDLGQVAEKIEIPMQTSFNSITSGSDFYLTIAGSASQAPEIWQIKDNQLRKVSSFNSDFNKAKFTTPKIVTYKSFDGLEIEAALYLPTGYQKNSQAIIQVHGGPSGRFSDRLDSWIQLLTANGYAVLAPNIRGSTGYGHAMLVSNRYDWGGADYKDVIAGLDYLIKNEISSEGNVGIGGWSYGGYMAAWAVTQTDRFKASISGAPMTDLAVEYGTETSGINAYDTWYMGTPYENPKLFAARSPLSFVNKVKTPTLIICGDNDVIDPIGQCYQFHRGLKRYDVETDLLVYPREGHGIREEKHQIDRFKRIIEWFDRYMK